MEKRHLLKSVVLCSILLLFLCSPVYFLACVWGYISTRSHIDELSEQTKGTIIEAIKINDLHSDEGDTSYYKIIAEYEVNGEVFSFTTTSNGSNLYEGKEITIWYDEDHPASHMWTDNPKSAANRFLIGIIVSGFMSIIVLYMFFKARKRKKR